MSSKVSSKDFPPDFSFERPVALKGEGIYMYADNGNKYLDGCCGAMTANLGHSLPEVLNSIKAQLDDLTFAHRGQFTTQVREDLAERISSMAPEGLNIVSLVNSGSEATEMAVKLICDYWNRTGHPRKKRIISRWPSFHGATLGALSLSGFAIRRQQYSEYLADCPVIEVPFCHRCPYEKKHPECNMFCAHYLQKVINRFGADTIAAVICEPVTGASGAGITPPDEYFPIIRDICTKNNIMLIFDEVITGFGRTGKTFAGEHWGVTPDAIAFAKGASSGYGPTAGVVISDEIYNGIRNSGGSFFLTGHTFGGNPLSAAGASAVLKYIQDNDVVNEVAKKGVYFEQKLNKLYDKYEFVTHVRGKGLLWGLELSKNKETLEPFPKEAGVTKKLVDIAYEENCMLIYASQGYIDGISGDSILLSPPLIITEEEIDDMMDRLDKSLASLQKYIETL